MEGWFSLRLRTNISGQSPFSSTKSRKLPPRRITGWSAATIIRHMLPTADREASSPWTSVGDGGRCQPCVIRAAMPCCRKPREPCATQGRPGLSMKSKCWKAYSSARVAPYVDEARELAGNYFPDKNRPCASKCRIVALARALWRGLKL